MPIFIPFITSFVCSFSYVDSRIISRHQKTPTRNKITILIMLFWIKKIFLELNKKAVIKTTLNNWIDPKIGQGL